MKFLRKITTKLLKKSKHSPSLNEDKIEYLIVHHSASDNKRHDNVETIRRWHKERGFSDIGYHFVITRDGVVHAGRPIDKMGAHTKGFNDVSIGVCLTGKDHKTPKQYIALGALYRDLKQLHPKITMQPHSKFGTTECPGFNL